MDGIVSPPTQSPCPMQHFLTWSELFRVLLGLVKAAIMAVVVVPMLAPSVSGYTLSMLITPIPVGKYKAINMSPREVTGDGNGDQKEKPGRNSPISGVIVDVNTELLCTTKVTAAPTRMAR